MKRKKLSSIPPKVRQKSRTGIQNFLTKLEKFSNGNFEAEEKVKELKKKLSEINSESASDKLSEILNCAQLKDLLEGLNNLLGLASKLKEAGFTEDAKEFDAAGGKKGVISFGHRIGSLNRRTDSSEQFEVKPEGHKIHRPQPKSIFENTDEENIAEPAIEIFEEGNELSIIGELTGIREEELKCDIKENLLVISTTGKRKYRKEISLPGKVKPESLKVTYKNGVLEIKLKTLKED